MGGCGWTTKQNAERSERWLKEQPNYYSIIPAHVRYDKELKPMEVIMYGELTALSNKYGYSYASNN